MAGYALDEGLQKHQKVYSFLKRSLPQERYEGVRVIEPCVIVSEDFNKAFKFAVLGDELLYITENPPKTSKDIKLTVELADIISVELIHDVAEFLGGELRSKNQHILIVYKRNGTSGQSLYNHSSPAIEISSSSKLALSASFVIASPVLQFESFEREGQNSPILKPRFPKTEDQLLSPRNDSSKFQSISNPNVKEIIDKSDADSRTYSLSSTNVKGDACSPRGSRPLPPPPPGHESEVTQVHSRFRTRLDSKGKPLTPTSSQRLRRKSDRENDLNASSSSTELDLPPYKLSSKSLQDFSHSNDSWNSNYCLSSSLDVAVPPRSPRLFHTGKDEYGKSTSGSFDSDDEKEVGIKGLETTEIHLYVLTEKSPMFMHLKSTWNNCILKSTLKCGREGTPTSSPTRSQSKVDNSQLMQLFHQLKSEILQSHLMEKTFVLVQELLTAAQKSFLLKKYFWKSPELFLFLVNQILVYLPQSQSQSSGSNRADELDFVVVLLETLVCMFRETEILPSRLSVAKSSKGQAVRELLKVITRTPSVGRKVEPVNISPAAHQLLCGPRDNMSANGRDEMTKLLREITNNSSALLYEIILLVQQGKCFAVEENVLNICWLMKTLESQETTITFVQRMMEQTQRPFSSRKIFFSPREAVLLYKQLSILRNFLEYSERISKHIRAVYAEEFRYYIRKDVVRKKVPVNYPLASPILKVLEEVTKLVLDQKTKPHCR